MEIITILPQASTSSANFGNPPNFSSNSDQQLKHFQDLILDVMISYINLKAQETLEETPSIKRSHTHKNLKKRTIDTEASQSSSLVTPPTPQEMKIPCTTNTQLEKAKKKLGEYRSLHNFQPFSYFLVLGVKGLFSAHTDNCNFFISNAMLFLCSFNPFYENINHPEPE
ncbi:hypothetical protein O181_048820 [Austropuccinia psidii MF-1]|uniref:Uncharacterized protein n=1 Tax=Austropuccinia psidii MF-1 TaxID=1389203 RepID=A0A9Q3DXY4_9BASI|nr:hypothetical protein [Austropuccinia psidii MF-1]